MLSRSIENPELFLVANNNSSKSFSLLISHPVSPSVINCDVIIIIIVTFKTHW